MGELDSAEHSFVFEQAEVSSAARERLFSKDKKRFTGLRSILSSRPNEIVDLKKSMSSVKNQGQRGTCSQFATLGLLEHFVDRHADYSEQCLAFWAGDNDPGNVKDHFAYIARTGVSLESDCPYVNPEDYREWKEATDEEKKKLRVMARIKVPYNFPDKIYPAFNIKQQDVDNMSDHDYLRYIFENLNNRRPVLATLFVVNNWSSGMMIDIPSEDKIKQHCDKTEVLSALPAKCSSHAVILTGYNDKKGLIYFKNSWGETWGLNDAYEETINRNESKGYGVFSYAYLTKFRQGYLTTLSH